MHKTQGNSFCVSFNWIGETIYSCNIKWILDFQKNNTAGENQIQASE